MKNLNEDDIYICTISPDYFIDFPDVRDEALDKPQRFYLAINVQINGLNFAIPFHGKLRDDPQLREAQYRLPTSERPKRGLNFSKCLLITKPEQISSICLIEQASINPKSQQELRINSDDIINKFKLYLNNYLKACSKNRENREPKFRYSTLHHYKDIFKEHKLF